MVIFYVKGGQLLDFERSKGWLFFKKRAFFGFSFHNSFKSIPYSCKSTFFLVKHDIFPENHENSNFSEKI